ncbi:MAG TPA: DsbA family protein [Candidatus Cybelea sp.]|nr:DsbA family protein [Candidatus Cybelea sp.]
MFIRRALRMIVVCGLVAALIAPVTLHADDDALTPAQREAVEKIVRETIVKHPEIILEAVQSLQQQRKDEQVAQQKSALAQHRKALMDDQDSMVIGNPKGDVTVVEFFDYRCPYCKQMEPAIQATLKEDGKVRLMLKEYPILGEDSVLASRAAIASRKQGKYMAFHDALMRTKGVFTPDVIKLVAKEVGLDVARLEKDMADPAVDQIIRANQAIADSLGIEGTPGFVIGDRVISGGMPLPQFRTLISDARTGCATC